VTQKRPAQPGSRRQRRLDASNVVYLDSSAIVKTILWEPESGALRRFLLRHPSRASCALARTEVVRAVRHAGVDAVARAVEVLRRVDLIRLDDTLLDAAAALDPPVLRALDAIHLAAAATLAERLASVVTYDERMVAAARLLRLPAVTPT
jgi:predicted nucleic acid-binding protein